MKAVILGIVTACILAGVAYLALGPISMSSEEAFANPDSVRVE